MLDEIKCIADSCQGSQGTIWLKRDHVEALMSLGKRAKMTKVLQTLIKNGGRSGAEVSCAGLCQIVEVAIRDGHSTEPDPMSGYDAPPISDIPPKE